eukprot:CAMPEP_0176191500 /NCGR_PEP_ID=MMETSP0121_2-20121125/4491_1 /TAXON_ID=160619 /ORGANISM="Kryptoperidinium foliaceum, Strain CCMP 1326" /LENGTH=768 /DNA_ID=CAMNT_0017530165 /DNA_START=144 /DNA_END=2450 /DNA_ORIENTATION=+
MTTTFQRCSSLDDASWTCFSLLFMGRTLDLAVGSDLQVHAWFLGLQHLIAVHGIGSMPMMSDAQFVARKVQLKLMTVAHRQGLVLSRYLVQRIRAVASGEAADLSMTPTGSAALAATPRDAKREKKRESAPTDGATAASGLKAKLMRLQAVARDRRVMAELAEAVCSQVAGLPADGRANALKEMLRAAAIRVLKAHAGGLVAETCRLAEAAESLAPQLRTAEKTERSMRKLQQRFEEVDARRITLEGELSATRACAEASSGARMGSSKAEAEASERRRALEERIRDVEARLKAAQGQQRVEAEAAQNRLQDEAIAAATGEKLSLQQQLEEKGREAASAREADARLAERLAAVQALSGKLGPRMRTLQLAAARVREGQQQVKADVQSTKQRLVGDLGRVAKATETLGEESRAMEEKYRLAVEDRKKLHNQILDLKGNIRVFLRVRPINAKELPTEPPGEATVQFRDDTSVGIFDATYSRRKWFEFDQVFDPGTAQQQVFEEAKPLATSVLDGYNVCVFAYGQTGSGKTHTMTGTARDPGLNTNVLRELFRIRDERRNEYEINISIAITEIYNEMVRDLLSPSPKKLDIKLNPDGSSTIPGLTELRVTTVEDVMKCIVDASKNRATSTTDMNEQSSRSHSIVTVRTQCALRGSDTYFGKIHLVDLAGSENTNKSGVSGQGMKEAQNINKSLSALGDVIQSLVAKNPHTPYRNSKLTMMLKDSLGGDSKTLMIVCSSPAQTNVTETLSSLNFASRARNVELGKAKRNSVAN